jgi:5-methylcytosine-specific restriction endonuclease McrA
MLSSIPDRELIAHLEQLRCAERETSVDFLHHLNEIERRSLHLRLGYASLFAYCTGYLRYSESAAARRVHAARCLRRFPAVGALLESGEINLVTLGLVAGLLTDATVAQWLGRIRGKSQREVEAMAAAVRPPFTLRDRARVVHVPAADPHPLPLAPAPRPEADSPTSSRPGLTPHNPSPAPAVTRPGVYIQFLVDQSFMVKYRMATERLSNRLRKLTFEAVFSALIDDFLRRNEPVARHERRERAASSPRRGPDRRPIPVSVRDAVFARDRARCTFVGSDGRRCDETMRLHVDHIRPVARGGSNDMSNLRLLCARHNRLQAERLFGRGVMDGFRKREE